MKSGDRVINRLQESYDRPKLVGTVLDVHDGCNKIVTVLFDGREFSSILPLTDLRLE